MTPAIGRSAVKLALVAALAAAGGYAVRGGLDGEAQLARGFEDALSRAGVEWRDSIVPTPQRVADDAGHGVTLSPVYAFGKGPTAFPKPLGVGDRITIAQQDGSNETLEVVDLTAIGADIVPAGAASQRSRLVLVTLRPVGRPGAPAVRFVIERHEAAPAVPADRTL